MNTERSHTTVHVHCNECGQATDHEVLHEEKREFSEDVGNGITFEAYDWYRLVACAGCKTVSMEHVSANSEDWEPDTGPNYVKEYFPPRTFRRAPKWVADEQIPSYIRNSLAEIYIAVQNRTNVLAGLGIRALLEAVMIDQVGDKGRFDANLQALQLAGHVSRGQFDVLESTLEVGHAAMHRRFVPSDEAIIACLDVTEHIIQSIHAFPRLLSTLRKKVPKRQRRSHSSRKYAKP